jgi:hypothetical protein
MVKIHTCGRKYVTTVHTRFVFQDLHLLVEGSKSLVGDLTPEVRPKAMTNSTNQVTLLNLGIQDLF